MNLLRIFISSVQKEFATERAALRDYLRGDPLLSRYFEPFLFEDLPADDRRTDEVYLGEVERCAVYLGLLGRDYGYEDAAGLSPTEHEFNRASALGKPRFVYVKGSGRLQRHPKMQALVRRASDQLIRRRFGASADLHAAVYASLVGFLEQTGRLRTMPFDAATCAGASLADLGRAQLDYFLDRAQSTRGYPLGPGTSMGTALAHLNLLNGSEPKHAAILLFGREPQRWLPASKVKCVHFHGTEMRKPIGSQHYYDGTVFGLVDHAVDFVMSKIDRAVGTRAESNVPPITYEVPREAVAEAIINAIAHRDYTSAASVQVMLFADRLEIWNPGELPPSLSLEQLTRPHASIPHNPLLADPLFLAGYIEQAGTGTLDMIARCREAGLKLPEFRQDGGSFVQTLWRPAPPDRSQPPDVMTELKTAVGLSDPQSALQICQVLEAADLPSSLEHLLTAAKVIDAEYFRKTYLDPLVAAGWLERTNPDKSISPYRRSPAGHAWLNRYKAR